MSYHDLIVGSLSPGLKMPPILEPSTTPREFVDTEHRNEYHRIIVGLVLENYSKYTLTDPRTSKSSNCVANREVCGYSAVDRGPWVRQSVGKKSIATQ